MAGQGFFDMHEKLTAAPRAPAGGARAAPAAAQQPPLTVSQLTQQIDRVVRTGFPTSVTVKGECCNYNHNRASGHRYFTLEDDNACLNCVIWRSDGERLKFAPKDGMEVVATGMLQVYPKRGAHQLYVSKLLPLGQGALELAFQQLKAKLEAEGLLAPERRRQLPKYPTRIAIVTSRETAALADMLKVLRRYPWVKLLIYNVPVQGDGAGEKIADALRHLDACAKDIGGVDLILLGRGGGAMEDLWQFNEECVARAILASRVPVITGIGHVVDVSIADLVADYHAHTPTEAAQVVATHWRVIKDTVDLSGVRMRRALRACVQHARQRLVGIERHDFLRRPIDRINNLRQQLDDRQRGVTLAVATRLRRAGERLARGETLLQHCHPRHALRLGRQRLAQAQAQFARAAREELSRRRLRVDALGAHLLAIGPEQVLRRGYSITIIKKHGTVLRSAAQLKGGERLATRLVDGSVESVAEDPVQLPLFE
jgi:exodeoxyribonuclease VII large subunit